MDILLTIVPLIIDDFGYTPAATASLKGSVEAAGFTSKIIDLNAEFIQRSSIAMNNFCLYNDFLNMETWDNVSTEIHKWAERIVQENPTWVGISVFSYNSHRATRLLSIAIKILNPDIKIVIGGGGIHTDKTFAEALFKDNIIDAYIKGEGEIALVQLLNGNTDYPGINGKPAQQIKNINDLAFPNFDDYELQTYENKKGLKALPITGSRGCVRACTFCDVAYAWPKFYYRSGQSIADEIIHQIEKYDITAFRFTDSLINGSMKAFRDMCVQLAMYRKYLPEHKKFTWDTHFIVRPEHQQRPIDFRTMKEAGAGTLLIGVESGSPSVREHMKKGYSDEDLYYTMDQLQLNNINCRVLTLIGYITETEQDFQQTMDMFSNFTKYDIIEEVNLGLTLNLLPNTPLHDRKAELQITQNGTHINDWICETNPDLDFKERLRRRIVVQAHCERLGYNVFEAKNYTKQLMSAWEEVNAVRN